MGLSLISSFEAAAVGHLYCSVNGNKPQPKSGPQCSLSKLVMAILLVWSFDIILIGTAAPSIGLRIIVGVGTESQLEEVPLFIYPSKGVSLPTESELVFY